MGPQEFLFSSLYVSPAPSPQHVQLTTTKPRLTPHLPQPSEECSAPDVQAVRSPPLPSSKPLKLTSLKTANAVRYGTAKAEWFLNAVRTRCLLIALIWLTPSRNRPSFSLQAKSSKPAKDHVNHPLDSTLQNSLSEQRVR